MRRKKAVPKALRRKGPAFKANGTLKKGYRFTKGGRPVKAKSR